ncbi:hypothetical protein PZN02_006070 (plasmid) [Sinorhizobium garamanticum]|uniref:Uncharacterized protein n=1 Tax=Sinorhizobium garamanticum TaxID=680247 RepID=A0ABY8DLI1_9HYPH|nr:hypothetical protein [Sinorhizobium garamanticum]WEX91755.1 hypothetical protein PZN02_006070 [Sinorhizobium garamanticum]
MRHTVVQTNCTDRHHLSDAAVHEHRSILPMFMPTNGMSMRDAEVVSTPADVQLQRSAGGPTLGDVAAHNNSAEASLGARLASVDIYKISALLHSLNLEFRDSARLDRQIARDCDIAAQGAAAKALRDSGLCQLVGTFLTSAFAIAGAGVSLKGASKAQARFDVEIGSSTARNKTSFKAGLFKHGGIRQLFQAGLFKHGGRRQLNEALCNIAYYLLRRAARGPQAPRARLGSRPAGFDPDRVYRAQQVAQRTTMSWGGVATGITELGKLGGAALNMGATVEQEKKAKLEAESTKMRSRADDESEFKSAYEKMIQDVLEKLSEVRRADADTRSKIANMG